MPVKALCIQPGMPEELPWAIDFKQVHVPISESIGHKKDLELDFCARGTITPTMDIQSSSTWFREAFLVEFEIAEGQLLVLSHAFSVDEFDWRPDLRNA